jgi:tetratricopeptide (TPR) repeat protein
MIWLRRGGARSEASLRTRARALPFLLAIGCASLFLATEASLLGVVSSFRTPGVGRWLLALYANDPRFQHQLGLAYADLDPTQSLRNLRRATQLSALNRLYWEDLESACESSSDLRCADQAAERLVELCPKVPSYHWIAGQSCLRTNRLDVALEHFRRALELDPTYAAATWVSLRKVLPPEPVYQKVLADDRDARTKVGFVDFVSDQGNDDAAYRIWRQVVADSGPFPFSTAEPYLNRLIGLGRIEEAVSVWQDLERLGIIKGFERNEKDNLVFNGGFEQEPLEAGFDWRTGLTTYLAIDFSAPGAYQGAHCLRIDFTVRRNNGYEPVYQIVPVLPQHAYTLEAFVRSQDITSNSGPCLRISDTQPAGFPDAVSETTVGTTPWHRVRLSFSTGPQTRAVRLSFWRPRGEVFPEQISGTFWSDAVSLECLGAAESGVRSKRQAARTKLAEAP